MHSGVFFSLLAALALSPYPTCLVAPLSVVYIRTRRALAMKCLACWQSEAKSRKQVGLAVWPQSGCPRTKECHNFRLLASS